jgi:hypothetical protein
MALKVIVVVVMLATVDSGTPKQNIKLQDKTFISKLKLTCLIRNCILQM